MYLSRVVGSKCYPDIADRKSWLPISLIMNKNVTRRSFALTRE